MIPSVFRSLAWLLFLLGVQPSPEARWKGRGSLFKQNWGGNSMQLFQPPPTSITTKKLAPVYSPPPRVPSPESGGWEHGSTTPPRSFSNGGTWFRLALCTFFLPFLFSFLLPLSIYSFFLFFGFFLSSFFLIFYLFFFNFFVFLSPLLPLGPPSPRPALPSVGEDQVGDAGLQPISRDHLAHLGSAIVRELEVGA